MNNYRSNSKSAASKAVWHLLDYNKRIIVDTMKGKLGLLDDLSKFFKNLHQDVTVNLYGSFSTGLCLYNSDVDLVLTYSTDIDKAQAVSKLREIRKAMETLPCLKKVDLITTARVPIIKCDFVTLDG